MIVTDCVILRCLHAYVSCSSSSKMLTVRQILLTPWSCRRTSTTSSRLSKTSKYAGVSPTDARRCARNHVKTNRACRFGLENAKDVQMKVHDMLFPPGKRDQASKYGAPPYKGGSIEAYLDRLLFLHEFRTVLHPQLHATARKWQNHEITSVRLISNPKFCAVSA